MVSSNRDSPYSPFATRHSPFLPLPANLTRLKRKDAAMAMSMKGEVKLPADRATIWVKLNDPETLKACIPGCQELVKDGDTAFRATAKLAIGPVKATFKGKVTLSDIDPPNGYTITGEGEGGIAGFAKGSAKVHLADAEGGGTLLIYDVQANVGGKIAQLGSRLIDGVAKKMSDAFFANFAKAVEGNTAAASP
jgi:carbon monoxide dehydrogenase subunit G